MDTAPIVIATRGSALALIQARQVEERFRRLFPGLETVVRVFRTTGDELQQRKTLPDKLPKGLFTREIETALLSRKADLAVHSLKDLPTELPSGLELMAVAPREDPREVLLSRLPLADSGSPIDSLPRGALVGTGSPRRQFQLQGLASEPRFEAIRGNVPTRIARLAAGTGLHAIVLAAAGLMRLGYRIGPEGLLAGSGVPDGIRAALLPLETMIPCAGQGAIGLEGRRDDSRLRELCGRFNHHATRIRVDAERTFLRRMGGGCLSPVAAHAHLQEGELHLQAAIPGSGSILRRTGKAGELEGEALATRLATRLRRDPRSGT